MGPSGDASIPDASIEEIDWSECARWRHDPSGEAFTTYPDDHLTRDDDSTETGLRISLSERAWVGEFSAFVQRVALDLDTLDGWGINAGIVVQVSGGSLESLRDQIAPRPQDGEQLVERAAAILYMENPEEASPPHFPAEVAVELRFFESGEGLILEPLRPLKPATRYGLILKSIPPSALDSAEVAEGHARCLAPAGEALAPLLDSDQSPRWGARRAALLERAGVSADEVAALTVFTTQSAVNQSREVAAEIRTRSYEWNDDLTCENEDSMRRCTRSFNALSFQDEQGVIRGATPQGEHPITVHIWRPRNRADETPTLLFGHGIGGDINNAYILDEITEGLPITWIAIDAVEHGGHPTADPDGSAFQRVLNFFALDIPTQTIQALRARDNFRQSTYDKLQLVELLHQDPDINADGRADLNLEKLGYYGLSLGGIMGVELLSLEPRFDLAILAVPGARLVSVLTDGDVIGDFKPAIYALVGGESVFNSITPLAQVLLDAADPGTYAPFVFGDLRETLIAGSESPPPHILMQVAMQDEVVPNSASYTLARALNLPHLKSRVEPISLLEPTEAPLSANLAGRTAGVFQFDRLTTGPQSLTPSAHNNVPRGREGRYQSHHFLSTWLSGEAPELLDPYAVFRVPPLESE